ncbi:hypothetical protein [Streptomyces griseofuscus]|uniref:hypothetical protein n=1 Tax=Streptomyces griseofuscus TaxID=146922 RepID=UPI00118B4BF6|nr:hypothetical protein SRO_1919 [Streptomyces rochei]
MASYEKRGRVAYVTSDRPAVLNTMAERCGEDLAPVPVAMPPHRPPALTTRLLIAVDNLPVTPTPHIMRTREAAGQAPFAAGSRIATHST